MRSSSEQAKARRDCFAAHKWNDDAGKVWLTCCICNGRIDPAREKWDAEHIVRHVLTNDNSADNVKPCHPKCHKTKTATDVAENAKGKRVSDKHFGIRQKRGWGKRAWPNGNSQSR